MKMQTPPTLPNQNKPAPQEQKFQFPQRSMLTSPEVQKEVGHQIESIAPGPVKEEIKSRYMGGAPVDTTWPSHQISKTSLGVWNKSGKEYAKQYGIVPIKPAQTSAMKAGTNIHKEIEEGIKGKSFGPETNFSHIINPERREYLTNYNNFFNSTEQVIPPEQWVQADVPLSSIGIDTDSVRRFVARTDQIVRFKPNTQNFGNQVHLVELKNIDPARLRGMSKDEIDNLIESRHEQYMTDLAFQNFLMKFYPSQASKVKLPKIDAVGVFNPQSGIYHSYPVAELDSIFDSKWKRAIASLDKALNYKLMGALTNL